jgi:hypothetical protein
MRSVLLAILATAGASHVDTIRWQSPIELATGGGVRGPWQQNNSHYDFVDDPGVALMANGDAAVVWVDQARKDVFWQIVAPDGSKRLAAPLDISRTPNKFSRLPRIGLSPTDPSHVYVLWQEIIFSGGPHGGEILFARSVDGVTRSRRRGTSPRPSPAKARAASTPSGGTTAASTSPSARTASSTPRGPTTRAG